jgi:hypothetical protein
LRMKLLLLVQAFFISSVFAANGLIYSRIIASLGSFFSSAVTASATDAAGNLYLTGWTTSPSFPVTAGVFQPKFGSGTCSFGGLQPQPFDCPDAFVIKLDPQGNLVFSTYLGGSGYDQANSIGVDGSGNIYVAGITSSFNLPFPQGSHFSGSGPTFIAKISPDGSALRYLAAISGTGDQPLIEPNGPNVPVSSTTIAMVVDRAGNAYFVTHGSQGFPVGEHPIQLSGNLAIGKLDPAGSNLLYATYFGGSGADSATSIAIDAAGAAYITGGTSSADFPVTAGALQPSLGNTFNSFVLKLNAAGDQAIYATYLGASSFAHTLNIRASGDGSVYVLGSLNSPGYPTTPNAFDTNFKTGDGFLSKITADGTRFVYSTFIAGGALMNVDTSDNVYVAGITPSGFPVSSDAGQPCYGGGFGDIFAAKFRGDGSLDSATYLGGSLGEVPNAIAVAPDGSIIVAGTTTSPDFPLTDDTNLTQNTPRFFATKLRIHDPSFATSPCLTLALENSASLVEGPIAAGELVTLRGLRLGPERCSDRATRCERGSADRTWRLECVFRRDPRAAALRPIGPDQRASSVEDRRKNAGAGLRSIQQSRDAGRQPGRAALRACVLPTRRDAGRDRE